MTNETIAKEVAEKWRGVIWEMWHRTRSEFGQASTQSYVRQHIEAAILEALTRSQSREWIPVETRLPEDSELYLVMVERVDEQPLRDIGWYDDRGWHTRSHLTTVTHWTLLPSAPKETR